MTDHCYIAVKGSLHSLDCSVFGLTNEEIIALSKRFYDTCKEVINGVLIKGSPIHVINTLSEIGYRVICSSGETEIVWTLRREVLVSKKPYNQDDSFRQTLSNRITSYGRSALPQKTVNETIRSSLSPLRRGLNEENIRKSPLSPSRRGPNEENIRDQLTPTVEKPKRIKPDRLGSKPEDKAEYGPKGSTIEVIDIESLEENPPPEEQKIILNTNENSEFNPLNFRNIEPQYAANFMTISSETIATSAVEKGGAQCDIICSPQPRIHVCESPGGKHEFVLAEYTAENIAKPGCVKQQGVCGKTSDLNPMAIPIQVEPIPQNVNRNHRIRFPRRRRTAERIGTKPEDVTQYDSNKRKIEDIYITDLEEMPEEEVLEEIILNTNKSSEENPLSARNAEPQENLMSRFAHSSKKK